MANIRTVSMLLAVSLAAAVGAAQAQAPGRDEGRRVNVYDFAVSHPVPDARLPISPALGDSVPPSVELVRAEGNEHFAYFYYAGQPVIVDLRTLSVVRIGE